MWKDDAWLLDMLNACRRIQRHAQGADGAAFLGDDLRQDAIVRQFWQIVTDELPRLAAQLAALAPPETP